jgi:hypothetical protein
MTTAYSQILVDLHAAQRQHEIIYDISFYIGLRWSSIVPEFRGRLMDHLDGSRGLGDKVREWAAEFDTWWETLAEDEQYNYMSDIDDFTQKKFDEIIAEVTKDRLTA